ncbi:hypothetical protein [Pararhizobium mangrovi]|uniref:Uncharacterized protein n=1 Tax=Pararhizobium mangrovi TaxID=2590452 RepID=A0A506TX02_9HYPH|nr:hypothetical protein [Pararhizobium mangrovi]TPW25836.1 hypothetical protein FJU11_17560 [Pararhizobium mangrovi]
MAKADLDDLNDNLEIEMPEAIKRHLSGYQAEPAPDLSRSFTNSVAPAVVIAIPARRFEVLSL